MRTLIYSDDRKRVVHVTVIKNVSFRYKSNGAGGGLDEISLSIPDG